MRDAVLTAAVALLAGAAGFAIGKVSAPSPPEQPATSGQTAPIVVRSLVGGKISSSSGPRKPEMDEEAAIYFASDFRRDLETTRKDLSPVARFASLARLLENLNSSTLPDVLEAFKAISLQPENLDQYQMLLYAWAKFDRRGALAYIDELAGEGNIHRDQLLQPVLEAWATENPRRALEWLETMPEEERSHTLKKGLMAGWAANDPYEAAKYLQTLPADQSREYLAGEITSHMYKQGTAEATRWAESLTDYKFKEQAFEELAEDWVSRDPEGLAQWLRGYVNEAFAVEAIEDLGRGWVGTDPDAATAWFGQLPEGRAKEMGILKMARTWADNDLVELGEWLNGLPDSRTTDLGVQAYSERMVHIAPEAAVESAMSIVDDGMRDSTVTRLAREWYGQDQEGALSWAAANGFSEAQLLPDDAIYARINAQQLKEVSRMIDEGNVSAQQMNELIRTQERLLREQGGER